MKRILLILTCLAITVAFSACNTVRGVGKDIERAGEGIQNATE